MQQSLQAVHLAWEGVKLQITEPWLMDWYESFEGDKIDPKTWRAMYKIAFGAPPVLIAETFRNRLGLYITPKDRKNHRYPAELSYFKWFL